MTWGADGTLYVALAGNGGTNPGVGEPLPPPAGPEVGGGPSAAVAAIGPDGCPVAVATGLPSSLDVIGTVVGVADVAILGDQLYALVSGGGGSHGNPDQPSGLYRVYADGSFELAADLQSWYKANPVARPAEVEPDGQWYGMVAASDGTALWVVESNGGQVLTVTPDGTITRVADLSQGHPVPTGIALAPDGGVYVGYLTAFPFVDGTSRVDRVAPDGSVSTVWSGLSMVTGIAVAPDGTLYATEMATGEPASMEEPPFQPFTGRVVRQSGADGLEEVATGMLFPVNLRFGPDGGLYVALPAARRRQRGGRHPPPRSGDRGRDPDAGWSPTGERLRADHAAPTTAGDTRADGVAGGGVRHPGRDARGQRHGGDRGGVADGVRHRHAERAAGRLDNVRDHQRRHDRAQLRGRGPRHRGGVAREPGPGRNRHAHGGPGAWHLRGLLPGREPRG